uniref:Uncharacterized protein n=1 Tax=Romanomermis culicivorax TaxID=13658 RepID=A0A915I3S1_ROMCU
MTVNYYKTRRGSFDTRNLKWDGSTFLTGSDLDIKKVCFIVFGSTKLQSSDPKMNSYQKSSDLSLENYGY